MEGNERQKCRVTRMRASAGRREEGGGRGRRRRRERARPRESERQGERA